MIFTRKHRSTETSTIFTAYARAQLEVYVNVICGMGAGEAGCSLCEGAVPGLRPDGSHPGGTCRPDKGLQVFKYVVIGVREAVCAVGAVSIPP